ncbi:hypothetical protein P3F89_16185 [Bacillus tropicus]|uniref:Rpn family recombination-promoting nuclease/putative transposase n=1 Tax=Bacillus tropicus TaxID=2026188 RepID=A0ABD7ZL72_9BACI|nr:hypothetical protein [Bacillus tropicus]WMY13513.1 hypothetical protein P3F89_16185 [Bacillus tropicus]
MAEECFQIHRNHKDIAQKSVFMEFKGINPLKLFDYDSAPIVQQLPNDFPAIKTEDNRSDMVFLLSDNTILHIEFQSNKTVEDVERFCYYHLNIYNKYKDKVKDIKTVVIYVPGLKNVKNRIETNQLSFEFDKIHLDECPGDKDFLELSQKILSNPKVELTKEEELLLVYNPLMDIKDSPSDRAVEIVKLVDNLDDHNVKFKIIGTVATLTKRFLTDEALEKIWEVFRMGSVFEKFEKEKEQEIIRSTERKVKVEVLRSMRNRNFTASEVDKIMKDLKVSPEELKDIEREISE